MRRGGELAVAPAKMALSHRRTSSGCDQITRVRFVYLLLLKLACNTIRAYCIPISQSRPKEIKEEAMKQKIVIKVQMNCDKCRSKAMALAAKTGGVDSVALAGDAKDQVVVVGDGVDSVRLTNLLRKKVGHAQLVEVAEVKKEEKKPEPKPPAPAVVECTPYPWSYHQYYAPPPHAVCCEYPAAYSWW
ncbi:hypothetical protein GUJ93_ZPchr0006g40860 [Zizania palustris]|uniref:HMA domain-containing protein n=1 Tax=Zizania palustris TaxID=103762 RepID=A0A8J5VTJ2_ZIZPA|nr:hypothetical protein GUJ93_ZPchr0006g40860 [Zizania palustris]